MNVIRKMEVELNKDFGFKVGDKIQVGKRYTATCQEVDEEGAIFMFDQYLDDPKPMNQGSTNEGGYEASDLRRYLNGFEGLSMFDGIRKMMIPFKKTGDLLRIPTSKEMFGSEKSHNYYEILSFKKQWPLMRDCHNRISFRGKNQVVEWGWLQNKSKILDSAFAVVNSYGGAYYAGASHALGVRVVFKLRMRGDIE